MGKKVYTINGKMYIIKNAMRMEGQLDKSKAVLLFDDVFDSGSTLMAMTNIMIDNGYDNIFVFTLTKTRIPG